MSKIIRATSSVKVTIEIELDQPWGNDCTVEQIYKQAKDEALRKLSNLFAKYHGYKILTQPQVKINTFEIKS